MSYVTVATKIYTTQTPHTHLKAAVSRERSMVVSQMQAQVHACVHVCASTNTKASMFKDKCACWCTPVSPTTLKRQHPKAASLSDMPATSEGRKEEVKGRR